MKQKILILTLLASTSMAAYADSILYGGVTGGSAHYGENFGNDFLYGVRIGSGILPFLDVEAGYMNLGQGENSGTTVDTSTKFVAIKPTFTLPMVDIYARAGLHQWDTDSKYLNLTSSDDGTDAMFGVGFDYFISDYFSIGASYTRYNIDDGEIDGYELNATFHLDLL
ncbi:porin family protein [Vibrio navarrensis]